MVSEMKDLEKIYDEQISPLMEQILDICKKNALPVFAEFQYSDDGFCKSIIDNPESHIMLTHLDVISQCIEQDGVNIDKYMIWCTREAKKVGHSSMYLNLAGVPELPTDSAKENE